MRNVHVSRPLTLRIIFIHPFLRDIESKLEMPLAANI